MSQWSYLDTDEERLPEGLERVGYDADSQRYTYRDRNDGSLWQGGEGNRYGRLERIGTSAQEPDTTAPNFDDDDVSAQSSDWRMFAPFLMLIILFLLIVWKVINR